MLSKWFHLKSEAINLRKKGISIREIELNLHIPRSTLSGWFRDVELTSEQKERLKQNSDEGLIDARKKAAIWHNEQKNKRIMYAQKQAVDTLSKIDIHNKEILDLALAILYLGEGFKKNCRTGIGNSDPLV